MREIRPYKIVLYILGIFAILGCVVFYVPEDGWNIFGTKIKFLAQENFYHPKKQENADITDILASVDTTMQETTGDERISHQNSSNGNLGEANGGELTDKAASQLTMKENGKTNLYAFFTALSGASSNKKKISILHYGDSQIEGDRMTSYLRQKIQNQFGGNGPGLIPATDVYNSFTFTQTYSENFTRYTCFGGKKLSVANYGAMASASRFTPEYVMDSTFNLDSLIEQTGWIQIGPSPIAYSRAKSYNNVKMHYNGCIAPTQLKVYQNGGLIHEEELISDGAQHTFKLSFASTPGTLKYEFSGKISPNICAFSLEGDYGVQVSNIAMRGSSGTVFGRIRHNTLRPMFHELNTKLVLLQFGGNSIPFFKDSLSVRNFASYFKSQIITIRRLCPDAMVIVIGPSDMASLEEGIYSTYEFLPYCVDRMREATTSAGGAFWSMYDAMGGKNSMPAWVEKGLAGKDHIHFSSAGAKFASQLFYDALLAEYSKWKNKTN